MRIKSSIIFIFLLVARSGIVVGIMESSLIANQFQRIFLMVEHFTKNYLLVSKNKALDYIFHSIDL